ncbi:hypothetical protein, unlikely [Trypanosoma brucei gambiense DAL972]|uniref:Uncharacterized protein n=1 Tax=Trypanosoma brucei gambiense (strain MHOM/CI/86/DAL972) TaxID=679716 RepID=C9ZWS2_TRYB9|nr:hypothetical protein, unlikely [Trypanosoma brucei gambiense DAL972]CBH13861.1 hypothetical protein, unlikely [Trypanosoma brucei gambiense DAL972]|eukprot:XP_011776137.1 hypothetical protein, unlikely [Trypanosoma brucei gambiense DAL972]
MLIESNKPDLQKKTKTTAPVLGGYITLTERLARRQQRSPTAGWKPPGDQRRPRGLHTDRCGTRASARRAGPSPPGRYRLHAGASGDVQMAVFVHTPSDAWSQRTPAAALPHPKLRYTSTRGYSTHRNTRNGQLLTASLR